MIDILVPVLGRPHRAAPLVQNIRDTTTVPHAITFICSPEDKEQIAAVLDLRTDYVCMDEPAGPGDYAKKINAGFQREGRQDCEWIFQAADDLTFQPVWAEAALKMADSGPGYDVVATNDLANASVKRGLFGTHNLIRRRYVTEQQAGQVLHEGYDHNYVDRELCGWAQHRGVYVFARHSHVQHSHPLWGTAPQDSTYRKSLKRAARDHKLFLSRAHLWGYHGLSAHERKLAA
jgi:hypothetical protein